MWRVPKMSGAVFIGGLALLLSLIMFSVITVVAYWTFGLLTVNMAIYLYKAVSAGFQSAPSAHPFR